MFLADNIAALYRICGRSSSSSSSMNENPGSSYSLRVNYIFLVLHFCLPHMFGNKFLSLLQLFSTRKICR
jgi:hypothetical protein